MSAPAEQTNASEEEWHYRFRGETKGPVTREALKKMIADRIITPDTMVWCSEKGPDWRALKDTDLLNGTDRGSAIAKGPLPPPPPLKTLNNGSAWSLALLPIIPIRLIVAGLFPSLTQGGQSGVAIIVYWAITLLIVILDLRNIHRSGRSISRLSILYALVLTPLYLFKRARAVGESFLKLWVWWAAFALSFLLSFLLYAAGRTTDLQIYRQGDDGLQITNAGKAPIRISSMKVNDRDDCTIKRPGDFAFTPFSLNIGDERFWPAAA